MCSGCICVLQGNRNPNGGSEPAENPLCAYHNDLLLTPFRLTCMGGGMRGRYLSIQKLANTADYMTLCEVSMLR